MCDLAGPLQPSPANEDLRIAAAMPYLFAHEYYQNPWLGPQPRPTIDNFGLLKGF